MLLVLHDQRLCQRQQRRSTQPSGGDDDDADAGPPQYGGQMIYGLEAETTNGWCLPEGQLAIAGIQVARTIYDTLTVPDGDGGFGPFLAESVSRAPTTRSGRSTCARASRSTTAARSTPPVVKNNIDAYPRASTRPAARCCSCSCSGHRRGRRVADLTLVVTHQAAVGLVAGLPLLVGPPRHHRRRPSWTTTRTAARNMIGTGPFQLEGVAGQRPPHGHPQPELLAEGRRRQPAAVPRRDRVPAHPRAAAAGQRRSSPARSTPSTSPATPGRSSIDEMRGLDEAEQVNMVESEDVRRGRLPHVQHHRAALRQPAGPPGGRAGGRARAVQRDPLQGHRHAGQRALRPRGDRLRRGHRVRDRQPGRGPPARRRSTRRRPASRSSSRSRPTPPPSCSSWWPSTARTSSGRHEGAGHARSSSRR